MKVTIVIASVFLVAALTAAAPAIPSDQPVQLVVMTRKALKALGVHFPHNQHQIEGTDDEAGLTNSSADSSPSQQHQHFHHQIRHSRRRYSKCPRGMKKDGRGKCRRVWGLYHR